MDAELDRMKSADFIAMAANLGYSVDPDASSRRSIVLRSGSDKVVVGRNGAVWIYFSVRDDSDNGTLVDFVQRRTGLSLGYVRKLIRDWMGGSSTTLSPIAQSFQSFDPDQQTTVDPHKKSLAVWNSAKWEPEQPYLRSRGLTLDTLSDPRFADTFRSDRVGNVIIPHRDRKGICGYERKNHNLNSFGSGTLKGIWHSRNIMTADSIMICEGMIDCLSLFQIGHEAAYVSFGGAIGNKQRDLLMGLFSKAHKRNCEVVIATDNDPAGEKFFDDLQTIAPMSLIRLRPDMKDWNELINLGKIQ